MVVENIIGGLKVTTWLHDNKVVMYFKITHQDMTPDLPVMGHCKWDGCYDFHTEDDNNLQHYCNINEYIQAFQYIEQQRIERVEGAE